MNDNLDGDEAMKNFEDLGRQLFEAPKPEIKEDEVTEEEQDDE